MAIYTSLYNDAINDHDKEWATVSRKVHCSQESLYDVYHFVKLDLVRATVAGRTQRGLSKFVNKNDPQFLTKMLIKDLQPVERSLKQTLLETSSSSTVG